MRRVILTLTYDMGDYDDTESYGTPLSTDPKDWEESFYQCDLIQDDLQIVKVEIRNE